ncbi:MAG: hypothetical protein Q8N87_02130 [bacterium]|nr:hypothetical protein [bacterium]
MTKNKTVQIVILILILSFGIIIGWTLGLGKGYSEGYLEGQEEIERKYQEKIKEIFPGSFEEPSEIFSISGKILEVRENALLVKAVFYPTSPFEEIKYEEKIVKLRDATEIIKETEEILEQPIEEGHWPFLLKRVPISFSELKVGDEVFVEAEENIKDKAEFLAKEIILQSVLLEE